jgi:hypothetical protein
MHIEIHIYPNAFSIEPNRFKEQLDETLVRISSCVLERIVTYKAGAIGDATLLSLDDGSTVVATIEVRKGDE